VLEILVRNPDKLISQRQLLQKVWDSQYEAETHYLRQHRPTCGANSKTTRPTHAS